MHVINTFKYHWVINVLRHFLKLLTKWQKSSLQILSTDENSSPSKDRARASMINYKMSWISNFFLEKSQNFDFLDSNVPNIWLPCILPWPKKIQNHQTSIMFWLFEWYFGVNNKVCSHEHKFTKRKFAGKFNAKSNMYSKIKSSE